MNKNIFIEELIKKADIVGIVSKYVPLQKKGANYFGVCPFHADTNPSMSVSSKKGIFKCFSCGVSGNAISFIQKYKKVPFIKAIKEVALMSNYSMDQIEKMFEQKNDKFSSKEWRLLNLNNEANEIFKNLLFVESNKIHLEYLQKRMISMQTIKEFELGFSSKGDSKDLIYQILTNKNKILGEERDHELVFNEDELLKASLINVSDDGQRIWDYFYNRITFPIYDYQGFLIGFIGRTVEFNDNTKYLLSNSSNLFNKSQVLYNFKAVYNEQPTTIIILEGNLDVLSIYEAKDKTIIDQVDDYQAVALMGVALTNEHVNILRQQKQLKNIIIWLDNDQAGKNATLINGLKLLQGGFNVFVINNDTNEKDVNDLLVKFGKQKINNLIVKNKIDFISYFIESKFAQANDMQKPQATEEILTIIVRYGNVLFKSQHLQLVAKITNYGLQDINDKFVQIQSTIKPIYEKNYQSRDNYIQNQVANTTPIDKNNGEVNMFIQSIRKELYDIIAILLLSPETAQKIIGKIIMISKLDDKSDMYLNMIRVIAHYMKQNKDSDVKPTPEILLNELSKNNLLYDHSKSKQKFNIHSKEYYEDRLSKLIAKIICDYCRIEINNKNNRLKNFSYGSQEYIAEQKIIDNLRKLHDEHNKK